MTGQRQRRHARRATLQLPAGRARAERVEMVINDTPARAARVERPAPPPPVDFSAVSDEHWDMHRRLENWARWSTNRERPAVSAGFSMSQSNKWIDREYGAATVVPVDKADAERIATAVAELPESHRQALHWCYQRPRNAGGKARELGTGLSGLRDLVVEARQMLVERNV